MSDGETFEHPMVLTTLVAALMLFSISSIALETGDFAPAFELNGLDGKPLRLADYRGKKAVYLVFWNTWCSYCIKKTPRYRKLQEAFGDRVEIIAVNTTWSDSIEKVEQFQQRFEINYPVAMDEGESLTERYAVSRVPTEFIIDIDGRIRYRNGVPEHLAAHIPDWYLPYDPAMKPALFCSK